MLSQKILLNLAGIPILSVLFTACQPGALVKKEPVVTHVDSVLFFEQKPVNDPFLENLKTENDREIVLHSMILPPPAPPPPDFQEVDGFRVQVFAGLDSLSARAIKMQLEAKVTDPVYLIRESGLFKVQAGDFLYRVDADNRNMVLRRDGFPGAWVVSRKIRIPVEAPSDSAGTDLDMVSSEMDTTERIKNAEELIPFRIQILATSDAVRARQIVIKLEQAFSRPAYFEKKNGLYKVYLGKFQERATAESVLNEVRKNGYPDAWMVY